MSSPSPAVSIHPSDSISQAQQGSQVSLTRPNSHVSLVPVIRAQPGLRPAQYPFEVLWNLEDCKQDLDVNIQDSNKSRPSMDRSVRHPDGTMLSDSEWSAIKSSARRIANELSTLQDTSRQARMRRTKMYYRTHHAREWSKAILRLEAEQPLLKLCSSNWKADHVLGNCIQAILSKESYAKTKGGRKKQKSKGKEREKGNDDGNDSTGTGIGSNDSRRRSGGVEASEDSSHQRATPPPQTIFASGSEFNIFHKILYYIKFFTDTGESSSRRRTTPPPQTPTGIDISMASPTTSMTGTSSMKRPGPSSPQGKKSPKKRRREQDNGRVASKINWMAPLTASIAGAKPTTAPQDSLAFIHVDTSCMFLLF
jgi:hypothetical protein